MSKAKRGQFGYEVVKGWLRLTVPAKYSPSGTQKRISLKMEDTPGNRAEAQKTINRIHAYITVCQYDPEKLKEYIFREPPEKTTVRRTGVTPRKEYEYYEVSKDINQSISERFKDVEFYIVRRIHESIFNRNKLKEKEKIMLLKEIE